MAATGRAIELLENLPGDQEGLKKFQFVSGSDESKDLPGIAKLKSDETQALECAILLQPERLLDEAFANHLKSCLRPGGHLIVQSSSAPALNSAISALNPVAVTQDISSDQLRRALDSLGFGTVSRFDIPDGYGGGELFLCSKDLSLLTEDPLEAELKTFASWEDIWVDRFGQVVRKSGVLSTVVPANEKAPVLVLCDAPNESAVLSDRLLYLRDIAVDCAEVQRGLVAVCADRCTVFRRSGGKPRAACALGNAAHRWQ